MAEVLGRRLKRLERGVPMLHIEEVTDISEQEAIQKQVEEEGLPTDHLPEAYFICTEITTGKK